MADKPKKFIKGHNPLKAKSAPKPLSKVKELERKKVCPFPLFSVIIVSPSRIRDSR